MQIKLFTCKKDIWGDITSNQNKNLHLVLSKITTLTGRCIVFQLKQIQTIQESTSSLTIEI